jgi:hypothetical protein
MTHITIEKEKLEGILAALESLSRWSDYYGRDIGERDEMVFLKAALAKPAQQEPVGIVETLGGYPDESRHEVKWLVPYRDLKDGDKLYTTPQQRPWVGLTDDDKETLILKHAPPIHPEYADDSMEELIEAVDKFLQGKNT